MKQETQTETQYDVKFDPCCDWDGMYVDNGTEIWKGIGFFFLHRKGLMLPLKAEVKQ
jgi:hypothetical protein